MVYDNVKRRCEEKGITICELERKLNFGNATIAGWKSGNPTAVKLLKVAEYFGCTMEELMKEVE